MTLASAVAQAAPLSFTVGFGGGIGYERLAGVYRDDGVISLRLGIAIKDHFAIDLGLSEDLERIEPAAHVGARYRPWTTEYWSPYLRGDFAVVGASHIGSNFDLTFGAGFWGRLFPKRFPWIAWFIEADSVGRVGELVTWSARAETGFELTAPSFWRAKAPAR